MVQFDEGTVRCIAPDLEGSGGTAAQPAPPGAFRAVEAIRGASVPSLAGDNTAAFSLTLTQEGAIILEKAFSQGTTPVGVIYDLKFTGLRPALNVKITADYEKIFNHFSAGLEAQVYWVKAGIDAGFEKLVSEGVIKIEVIDFIGAEDRQDKENWALDFFKENLLSKWFEPSLTPADMEGRMAKPEGTRRGAQARVRDAAQAAANTAADPTSNATPNAAAGNERTPAGAVLQDALAGAAAERRRSHLPARRSGNRGDSERRRPAWLDGDGGRSARRAARRQDRDQRAGGADA